MEENPQPNPLFRLVYYKYAEGWSDTEKPDSQKIHIAYPYTPFYGFPFIKIIEGIEFKAIRTGAKRGQSIVWKGFRQADKKMALFIVDKLNKEWVK